MRKSGGGGSPSRVQLQRGCMETKASWWVRTHGGKQQGCARGRGKAARSGAAIAKVYGKDSSSLVGEDTQGAAVARGHCSWQGTMADAAGKIAWERHCADTIGGWVGHR
eukprot:scaffold274641_cov18-Tisochrysis_lutea.AAC.2